MLTLTNFHEFLSSTYVAVCAAVVDAVASGATTGEHGMSVSGHGASNG